MYVLYMYFTNNLSDTHQKKFLFMTKMWLLRRRNKCVHKIMSQNEAHTFRFPHLAIFNNYLSKVLFVTNKLFKLLKAFERRFEVIFNSLREVFVKTAVMYGANILQPVVLGNM